MTLTLTTNPTQAELLDTLKAMPVGQQNIIRQGYNAYSQRQMCFWVKYPATKADAQALRPDYVTEIAPGQFKLTDRGVQLYRAWLNQPLARPHADKLPVQYHGTHHSRNYIVRDMFEQRLPSNGLPAATPEPSQVSEKLADPAVATEPVHAPASVPPTPPQPPVPPTPAVVQLDLTAFIRPLLAKIEALEAQLAAQTKAPAPQPRLRRKSRAAMPMPIVSRRGGAA